MHYYLLNSSEFNKWQNTKITNSTTTLVGLVSSGRPFVVGLTRVQRGEIVEILVSSCLSRLPL